MQFINHRSVIYLGLMGISFGAIAACSPTPETASKTINNPSASPSASPSVSSGISSGANNSSTTANNSQKMMGTPGVMDHSMTMELGPADANYDLRFIDGMILHHQGAVVMAREAQQKSTRPEIKKLAADIITAQQQEISKMQAWRTSWYPNVAPTPMGYSSSMAHMMPMEQAQINSMMMNSDLGAADNQFDLRFINGMIPHHEGALVMAKDTLGKSSRPEIKQLAEAILSSQTGEIDQMKKWRKDWYNN